MSKLDQLTKSLVETYANKLEQQQKDELMLALEVLSKDLKYNVFGNTFPLEGEYSKDKYPKHMEFFQAGLTYTERAFIAGNRTGKSIAGAFETTCHATGMYPDWWEGKRFHKPLMIWVGGDTATTCRDIIQNKLLGATGDFGSGMIPKDRIIDTKTRRNIPDGIEIIYVKHVSGGTTTIVLKTYEQGRASWQGSEVDFIWIDEECPEDVYSEAIIRLMTTQGSIILTFTPLSGLTSLVVNFLDNNQTKEGIAFPKFVANVTWSDVPHLKQRDILQMLEATPPALRDARSKGIPTVGSGLIYPIMIESIQVDDFKLPVHWQRAYGMDVGWKATAATFGAWDRDNDIIYIYSEYKAGQQDPVLHGSAIKSRGKYLKGAIDPASRQSGQKDGEKLFELYTKKEDLGGAGLHLRFAVNAIESGIFTVWDRLNTGRLKFFKSCTQLEREFSLYHRDKKGDIVKTNDHLLDALRYLIMAENSLWQYPKDDRQIAMQKVVDMSKYMNACV